MCFTFSGRLGTRLYSLAWPLVVTALFSAALDSADYWSLFALMVIIGFALDIGVYSWAISYQPRWLTIVLGGLEFFAIRYAAQHVPLFAVHLTDAQAAFFYVCAWLGAWVTTQMVLPLVWPRWAENGGESGG